jgi:hypothetical protein
MTDKTWLLYTSQGRIATGATHFSSGQILWEETWGAGVTHDIKYTKYVAFKLS